MVFLKGYSFHILKVALIAFAWRRKNVEITHLGV
jgi:hypothetical protein